MEINKYHGGGLGDLDDPNIPKAEVQIYLRSKDGEVFHVGSLAEGIAHLLSKDGYRLSIQSWPHGAGWQPQNELFNITIYRMEDWIFAALNAPGVFAGIPIAGRVVLENPSKTRQTTKVEVLKEDLDGVPMTHVILGPGKEIPWSSEPFWGETDLPTYPLSEIIDALIKLRNSGHLQDFPSNLPDELKVRRESGDESAS